MAIAKLSSGRYQATYQTTKERGKRTFLRQKDAEAWLLAMGIKTRWRPNERSHLPADVAMRLSDGPVKVSECFAKWRKHIAEHKRPSYVLRCDTAYKVLGQWMVDNGAAHVCDLNLDKLDLYHRARRASGRAPQTIQNEVRTLLSCLNWCRSRGTLRDNPIAGYRPPSRIVHDVPAVPSPEELQRIFEELPDRDTKKAFWGLLALGCRFGAFAALKTCHVLPSCRLDFTVDVKGGWSYKRPMPALPFDLPTAGYLFTCAGQPWRERLLLDRIKRSCKRAGVAEINIHTLRHVFATFMLAGGEGVGVVASLGGWRTMAMLDRYRDTSVDAVSMIDRRRQSGYLPLWH